MIAVLRIGLTYFQMVPLQRWLNVGGLLLLVVALGVGIVGDSTGAAGGVFSLCLFGMLLMVIAPAMGGGIAMRMASRPSIVHLRPYGRLKVFAGTTLALSLIVLAMTVPSIAVQWFLDFHDLQTARRFPEPSPVIVYFWPVAAVGWILLFAASRTPLVFLAFPVLVVIGVRLPPQLRELTQHFPSFTPGDFFLVGLAAWLAFGAWYLMADKIRQPAFQPAAAQTGWGDPLLFKWMLGRENAPSARTTPAAAAFHYLLGCGSYRLFVGTGLFVALIFVGMQVLMPKMPENRSQLMGMTPFLAIHCATMGYTCAGRARLLWLRADMDRRQLFALAEKLGLRACMTTWFVVAAAVFVFEAIRVPERAPLLLLFLASQAAAAVSLFYGGMVLVRDWSAGDKAITVGLILLFLLQLSVLGPQQAGNQMLPWTGLLVIAGMLALALRWFASRRWRALDWRLARPPKLNFGRR